MNADASYPKSRRLRRKADFRRVLGGAEVFPGRQALVRRLRNRLGHARLGVSTPHGYGNAVRRNRFRRLAREAFRNVQHELGGHDLLLSPRRHLAEPTLAGLVRDLRRTLTEAPVARRERRRDGTAS